MNDCLDEDALISVGNAVEWDTTRLKHVATCASCQDELRRFRDFRRVLGDEMDPGPDFASSVVDQLPDETVLTTNSAITGVNLVATPLVAGLTGGFATAFVVQGSNGVDTGMAMLLAGVVVTLATLGWNAMQQLTSRTIQH